VIDDVRVRSPRGELVLRRRADGALELRVNGVFVMDTTQTSSERALATSVLAAVERPRRVLVAGLGLGCTLAAVLDDERIAHVDVVELERALIDWLRADIVPGGAALLADPRVRAHEGDVAQALDDSASYDVVLLDVDNGPDYLVHDSNIDLYRAPFLARCAAHLRSGGALGVWSMNESLGLAEALGKVFAEVCALPQPVRHGGRPQTYWLHLATSPRWVAH